MATRMYWHREGVGTLPSGTLPSTEQSSLAPDANLFDNEDGSENRVMNTTVSAQSQTSVTNTSTNDTNAHNYYIMRFVSPMIDDTSISANTWTVQFAASEGNANANFPRTSTGAMRPVCYVWKPSNGTKYGNIIDGNSNTDGEEAGTSQTVMQYTFSGSAVSSLTAGDACIVFELWAIVTQGMATAYAQNVFYDGTTDASTTNEAAYLETPQNLTFTSTQQNIERSITETVTISDTNQPTRLAAKTRALATETVTISESPAVARLAAKTRALTPETITVSDSLSRLAAKNRPLGTETVTISDQVDIVVASNVSRTLEDTVAVSDSVARLAEKTRTASDTTVSSESVARQTTKNRSLSTETVISSDSVARVKGAMRSLATEIITIGDSVSRLVEKIRTLSDTTIISDSVVRLAAKTRSLATQTVAIADNVVQEVGTGGNNVVRSITENISISDSVARLVEKIRAIQETVNVSDAVARLAAKNRALPTETVTVSDLVNRAYGPVRSLVETVVTSDSVARLAEKIRTISETVNITEQLALVNSNTPAEIVRFFTGGGAGGRRIKRYMFKLRRYWS